MDLNSKNQPTNTRPPGFISKNDLASAYGLSVKTLMKKVRVRGLDLGRKKLLSPGEIEKILVLMGGEPDWGKIKYIRGKTQSR